MFSLEADTVGEIDDKLTIESNDPNSPTEIAITANVQPVPEPEITVSPGTIDFGNVTVSVASELTVSVGNDGNADLKDIVSVSIT